MTPPPSTPKRPRKAPPKIIGHTAPTPRVAGTTARSSLSSLAPTHHRPSVRTPTGAPGMRDFPRNFPRPRDEARHAGAAVSVRKALNEQAELAKQAAPAPELLDPAKPRRNRKPAPARPTVRGRPSAPDEQPLTHAPRCGSPRRAAAAHDPRPPPRRDRATPRRHSSPHQQRHGRPCQP
jgi:hypothetical protein